MALNSKIQVPLPEKGIIIARTGKYPYVYHVTETFRDDKGQPTNKRRSIGKLDKQTGKLIPNDTYYEFYGDKKQSSIEDADEIRETGIPFLVTRIFSNLGLDSILKETFGEDRANALSIIAAYMLLEGNVMSYLDDFCERSLCKGNISDKSASRLFKSICNAERMNFFRKWVTSRCSKEYIAYDVTSFSSYAEGITNTEWGYNRDGEKLPQINLGLYIGQTSLLPLFYVTYPGSIVDKSHLPAMMAYNIDLDIKNMSFVMDKGFASTINIEYMRQMNYPFIIAVENRFKAFHAAIIAHKNALRTSRRRLENLNIFGIGVKGRFYGVTTTLHIYFDHERESAQIADMYRKIASEKEELAQLTEATEKQLKKYRNHFIITPKNGEKGFSYELNYEAIDELSADLGYFCILTNDSISTEEALSIYRRKDTIEKAFCELKNRIEMKRLRTHNQDTTEGKMFCAFLALIVRMHIENTLSKWMEENYFTVERVLRELTKVRSLSTSSQRRLLNPLTKKQREILSFFGASIDDVKAFVES